MLSGPTCPEPTQRASSASVSCSTAPTGPLDGALARGDVRAVRWLFSVALLERVSFETNRDILRIRCHLVSTVLGPGKQGWESVLWCSYTMKSHQLTEVIETLPIYGTNPAPGPHKVATFEVE